MSANDILQAIPVVTAGAREGRRLHRARRAVQVGTLVLAVLIPLSGLFRIDPVAGAFVVVDRQIWFSDFTIVVGLWLAVSCLLVMTYSFVGMAFCGWVCPQNTLSEWADRLTRRRLGKRVEVSLDGRPVDFSSGKNRLVNWLVLGGAFLAASLAGALLPLLYFYPPDVIWSFVTFRDDARLAGSIYWIYTVFVLILLVNITFIRHFWCRFMCVYRVWQHAFKTRETLRIVHDDSRADECARCNYCETVCFIGVDPRRTETYDACINCGECITACSRIRASRKTGRSLLRFVVGAAERTGGDGRETEHGLSNVGSIMSRAPGAAALALFGLSMFAWGLWTYEPWQFSVYRAETLQGGQISDYRISIANKLYRPAHMEIEVSGLPEDRLSLSRSVVAFDEAGREDVNLHVDDGLEKGIYSLRVVVTNRDDGTVRSYRLQHFAEGKHQ